MHLHCTQHESVLFGDLRPLADDRCRNGCIAAAMETQKQRERMFLVIQIHLLIIEQDIADFMFRILELYVIRRSSDGHPLRSHFDTFLTVIDRSSDLACPALVVTDISVILIDDIEAVAYRNSVSA